MYPELERNNKNPDIKCPFCNTGMDIYTECNEDENYTIQCLECNATLEIKQEIFKHYKLIKF